MDSVNPKFGQSGPLQNAQSMQGVGVVQCNLGVELTQLKKLLVTCEKLELSNFLDQVPL